MSDKPQSLIQEIAFDIWAEHPDPDGCETILNKLVSKEKELIQHELTAAKSRIEELEKWKAVSDEQISLNNIHQQKWLGETIASKEERDSLTASNAALTKELETVKKAVSEANWLLSNHIDAGGGITALLAWAKAIQTDTASRYKRGNDREVKLSAALATIERLKGYVGHSPTCDFINYPQNRKLLKDRYDAKFDADNIRNKYDALTLANEQLVKELAESNRQHEIAMAKIELLYGDIKEKDDLIDEIVKLLNILVERKEDSGGFFYTMKIMGGCNSNISKQIDAALNPEPKD